jgi:hypothetical protein
MSEGLQTNKTAKLIDQTASEQRYLYFESSWRLRQIVSRCISNV